MQYSTLLLSLFASVALSMPTEMASEKRQLYIPCSGLYSNSQCCATDVLGVADLDCQNPPTVPTNATEYQEICAAAGQRARCCAIPILGQAVLCQTPTGVLD